MLNILLCLNVFIVSAQSLTHYATHSSVAISLSEILATECSCCKIFNAIICNKIYEINV